MCWLVNMDDFGDALDIDGDVVAAKRSQDLVVRPIERLEHRY